MCAFVFTATFSLIMCISSRYPSLLLPYSLSTYRFISQFLAVNHSSPFTNQYDFRPALWTQPIMFSWFTEEVIGKERHKSRCKPIKEWSIQVRQAGILKLGVKPDSVTSTQHLEVTVTIIFLWKPVLCTITDTVSVGELHAKGRVKVTLSWKYSLSSADLDVPLTHSSDLR